MRALVLVVEDEPLLRLNAVAMLEEAGYHTLQAGSAEGALVHLEANADIRAVCTDINMPGTMDGRRLAAAIRERWPPIELILTSGILLDLDDLPSRAHFLPKPYSAHDLIRTLRTLQVA